MISDCHERCWDAARISYHMPQRASEVYGYWPVQGAAISTHSSKDKEQQSTQRGHGKKSMLGCFTDFAGFFYLLPWFVLQTSLVTFISLVCFSDFPGFFYLLP